MTFEDRAVDFAPWHVMNGNAPEHLAANAERVGLLRERGYDVAGSAFVARGAVVDADRFTLGERSYLAEHVHVGGDVSVGNDTSLNVATEARGLVRIGDGVRIGARTAMLGFDHGFEDVTRPIREQPHSRRGITIEDDVWLGAHVIVLDGVTIGAHSVVGAGAVVTKDVPAYAIAVGNPARVVRDRRVPRGEPGGAPASGAPAASTSSTTPGAAALAVALGEAARRDVPGILARALEHGLARDAPDVAPTVRATCDAIELGDLLGLVPGERADLVALLQGWQRPDGLVPELGRDGIPGGEAAYHVLCVGYALDLIGARFPVPLTRWLARPAGELGALLDALPWAEHAWGAGSEIDTIGTALTWAAEADWEVTAASREVVLGWLAAHRDPATGLWGSQTAEGLRQPVNGAYRLVRGTLAQWGVDLGGGEVVTDTVLRHARTGILDPAGVTACDALDVAHLLWWARRTGAAEYRSDERAAVAHQVLTLAHDAWRAGEGAPFAPGGSDMVLTSRVDPAVPSLQGSEMWLATAWYAADLLGVAPSLGYTPRGIHRPTPRP